MIQLENVHKSYGQTKVLKGLICRFKTRMMWLSWDLLDQESQPS